MANAQCLESQVVFLCAFFASVFQAMEKNVEEEAEISKLRQSMPKAIIAWHMRSAKILKKKVANSADECRLGLFLFGNLCTKKATGVGMSAKKALGIFEKVKKHKSVERNDLRIWAHAGSWYMKKPY